ncbi:hypothetical protein FOA52_009243 [Chlamydomonas sp. UWO 241]|nr:hypothetical protein FOA52_009243 [Chlamydomonas sp. UWO 241]
MGSKWPALLVAAWCFLLPATCSAEDASSGLLGSPPLAEDCPSWVTDYVAFHRENRGKEGAKYLVWSCTGVGQCAGLSDRMRGTMYCLKVAAAFNRVLLIHQTVPAPTETFFTPTHINWTTVGIDMPLPEDGYSVEKTMKKASFPYTDFEGVEELLAGNETWVTAGSTNTAEDAELPGGDARLPGYGGGGKVPTYSRVGMCMQNALYRPSERVEAVFHEKFDKMRVDPSAPYVALHMRTYQMVGEMDGSGYSIETEDRFLTTVLCARDMAKLQTCGAGHAGTQIPIVLVTDSVYLRLRVLQQLYAGV